MRQLAEERMMETCSSDSLFAIILKLSRKEIILKITYLP